jgi:hypothetical protein
MLLFFLSDLIPEVNYTSDPSGSRGYTNPFHPPKPAVVNPASGSSGGLGSQVSTGSNNNNNPLGGGGSGSSGVHNPKNPVFVPSPVSSKGSGTMYNMDQLTNNIAIPKHTLTNPSNLATSRSTIVSDDRSDKDKPGESGQGGLGEDRDNHHDRYSPNSSGSNNHLDESRGETGNPYAYEDEDNGLNEDSAKTYVGSNPGEAQGKRGIWKGGEHPGQDQTHSRDENGMSVITVQCSIRLESISIRY